VQISEDLVTYLPLGFIIFIIFFMEIWLSIKSKDSTSLEGDYALMDMFSFDWLSAAFNVPNIKMIGNVLYTYTFYPFILASLILLVAMIGSIVLTLNKSKETKSQNIYKQLKQKVNKSILLKKFKN
jgi:NADH:ubiquinone oxidoreductase subunit 6 (subunit J)